MCLWKIFLRSCFLFLASCFLLQSAIAEQENVGKDMWGSLERDYSIEFRNADLKDAMRFLAKVAGINMIIPDGITGLISTTFKDTSIKDAINSIIRANGLDFVVESGGIWRIGKGDALSGTGEDLKTETFRLKYALAKELAEKVKGLMGSKGSVLSDDRTNTLTIRDKLSSIESVRSFLKDVDVRDMQVLIEAKIVEVSREFSRNLGVQWGVTSTGTRAQVAGLQGVGAADSGNNLIVDLPMPTTPSASTPTGGLGLVIGSLAGGTTIDIQLSAAEQNGDADVISEPTIVTSNGVPAQIRSGETIYIKTTGDISIGASGGTSASGGSGLQTVTTGIQLNVTPQISVDNYIKLAIQATTSEADFSREVEGLPVVVDNNASTSVVVKDGETTIIGGLSKLKGSRTRRNVPGLSRIPILGALFKSRARYRHNKELMVFIKPTIIRDLSQVPQNAKYGRVEDIRDALVIPDADKKRPLKDRMPASRKAKSRNKYLQ